MSEHDDADGSADFHFCYSLCMIAAFWRLSFSLYGKLRKKQAVLLGQLHGKMLSTGLAGVLRGGRGS